jgi:hypothetical protein
MWKVLTDLFQNSSDHRKLALKDKLRKIKMEKGDTSPKYLTKFVQCRDELGSVGITVVADDLVSLALLGIPKSSQLSRLCQWKGKIVRLGTTVVRSSERGVQMEHQRWIFIKA